MSFFNILILLLIFFRPECLFGSSYKTSQENLYSVMVNSENQQLSKHINKQLNKYKDTLFSKVIEREITENILSILKDKKVLLPDLNAPVFYKAGEKLKILYKINNPYQYGFVLIGNKNVMRSHLISKDHYIQFFNNSQLIRKVLFNIKEEYLKRGYANIELSHEIKTNEKDFIKTVYISIKEGQLVKIKDIHLSGEFSRSADYYVQFIKKHGGSLVQRNYYYNQGLQKGLKNLINLLKNTGYLSAKGYLTSSQKEQNRAVIEVNLQEGPLSRIKNIVFNGNKYFSDKQLMNAIQIKPDTALDLDLIEQAEQRIVSKYKTAGFIEIILKNRKNVTQYNEKTKTAVLYFDIQENTKIKIVDIFVKKNKSTKTSFILNNIPIKKGDYLTIDKIDQAIKNLRNLGIFSSINISTKPAGEHSEDRVLIVQTTERKPRSLRLALGLNTQRTLTSRGFVEFTHKNILGSGRRFFSHLKLQSNIARYFQLSSIEPEYIEHQILASYFEPFILGSGFSGQIQLSNSSQIFSHSQIQGDDITNIANTTRINFLLQRKLNHFIHLNWIVAGLERRKEVQYNKDGCIRMDSSTLCSQQLPLDIGSTGLAINIDKRNNIIAASEGFLSRIFLEYVWPFNSSDSASKMPFIKTEIKHFDFRSIYKNWILVNSFHGGLISGLKIEDVELGFPVSRGFILGGISSLRGFDGLINGERVPDAEELPIEGANALIAGSSSFYFLLKSECRFPITDNLLWTVFYDGGMVGIEGKTFAQPYRHSAGVGLRYKTPLGPVAGYIAVKILPKENESPFLLHLSFGEF